MRKVDCKRIGRLITSVPVRICLLKENKVKNKFVGILRIHTEITMPRSCVGVSAQSFPREISTGRLQETFARLHDAVVCAGAVSGMSRRSVFILAQNA